MSLSHGYTMEDKFGQLVRQVKGRNLAHVALEITENVAVQFACELKALLHPTEIVSPFDVETHRRQPLWQASNMTLGIEDIALKVSACTCSQSHYLRQHPKGPLRAFPPGNLGLLHKWALVRCV